ncbi:type II toxin-antitoxin system RelE/ParE family toxin [Parapedobacter sp. 10938]|uniref:type II toxin-antitoxin system RelE/ParE family toxin n=1 Tax=Parapedobacter flavus TaxID=3110225 RepID=UPI002DBAF453|nr:type II toxin-antitoxin system RelE/ParE family toxin [Parapedobacter sp. 10938]MEC3881838.1 type II toxin-antitoxin system RelE/ParE family toxin [Parapedobacter sp. 10938]
MIKTFKHKGLRLLWTQDDPSKLQQKHVRKIRMLLQVIDSLNDVPNDLSQLIAFRPHPDKGMENVWSLDVSGNYRILFRFVDGNAYDIDYIDPH